MKIRILEDDYMDFLYKHFNTSFIKDKLIYPFKNPGFNMSISQFYNKKYIVSIRNVIPFSVLLNLTKKTLKNPIIQGIVPRKTPENNIFKETFNNRDYSQKTIWDWFNTYESTIFFICDLDINNLKLKVDKSIEPYVLYRPQYFFPIEEKLNKKLRPSQHYYPQEDFRIYFKNNICYTYDSYVNQIKIILLENNILNIQTKYNHVCNYRFTKNDLVKKNEFKKIFEKNWTLYNIIYKKNKNKEKCFQFIHDFLNDGLYGVDYYPSTQKCFKKLLVPYKKYKVPINLNNDYCRFSVGSTSLEIYNNKYLVVGHIKINIKKIKDENMKIFNNESLKKIQKIYNSHFFSISQKIHKELKKKYSKKYRPHHQYIYGIFLFLFDNKNKNIKLSNIFLPLPNYKYVFSLSFPMSILKVNNEILISSGYGDFTNILIKFDKNELNELLKYDIKDFDPLSLEFVYIK